MDKSILIQKQIRDNADDLQSFMRDLTLWEQEMKRKEIQTGKDFPQDLPPIRKKTKSSEQQIESKNVSPSPTHSESKPKKISSFDYQAWDKLDVRTASQLIKFWDNEKTKRKRILANARLKQLPTLYPDYSEANFSGVENADINVFLETSVDTGMNGMHNSYMSSEEDIKPFNFEGQNGFDTELENNIDEMSVATTKGQLMIDYDPLGKGRQCHSENGDGPSYSSSSYAQPHSAAAASGVSPMDGSYERKSSVSQPKTERVSKIQQELDEIRRQHEKDMNALKLEEMKFRVELAKKEVELKEKYVELESKKIESLLEKEKFERAREALELDILRKKLG